MREGDQQEARCECCEFASDGRDCICAHPEVKVERRLARSHGEGDEARREAGLRLQIEQLQAGNRALKRRRREWTAEKVGLVARMHELEERVEQLVEASEADALALMAQSAPPHLLQDEAELIAAALDLCEWHGAGCDEEFATSEFDADGKQVYATCSTDSYCGDCARMVRLGAAVAALRAMKGDTHD